ncbi:malto-oligosyltrehalose synthase [Sphingosinicella terrae]|uniref:malto-oligosyltrehalose synthase n=1 Tax=Sphingosinicella terrae TaxID=2172047 RepID=UPI000E0DE86D|nr:malto-oligosyltrehalose synthase [Sphingosinicella terrae]
MIPRATYRLQLNRDFTFADAEAIVPYLDRLGISHVYASPVTAAQPGSTHGYDVIDPTRINPELGGEAGLRGLAEALRARAMGLVIDIVPNHMSVTGGANIWWNDVLAHGRASRFARFFDVDGDEKILLPFLGSPVRDAIDQGALRLEHRDGRLGLLAHDCDYYPLRDEDQDAGGEDLAALLDRQHYRLAWWRTANDLLNWRRFFTITGLAGVRVEDEVVFEATHQLYFRLHEEGLIDGVRVDHVDGLADPAGYCRRLRERLGPQAWIVVEKILGPGETLRDDWGVDGTSGYDFMEETAALLHDAEGEPALSRHWTGLTGRTADFAPEERLARRQILAWEFEGQLGACVRAFARVAQASPETEALTAASLRRAIEALLQVFPAYRTYGDSEDAGLLGRVRTAAADLVSPGERDVLDQVVDWLGPRGEGEILQEARRRFRQLSAPIAAKAVEDTAFYRYGRLLSRNDVGFDAARFSLAAPDFHRAMANRAACWPMAMLTTATHDHKRGEDVRARLAVLSELPGEWTEAADRWRASNGAGDAGIDPGDEYMVYQMLVGAWPDGLAAGHADALAVFRDRIWAWLEKAVREAKLHSSWTAPDQDYEGACRTWLERLLDPGPSSDFLTELCAFVDRIRPAGEANSLVQTFLRCTAPGVPDCYQGCEFGDLSLVDPDNRRPVDYGARAAALDHPGQSFDAVKQGLLARLLAARRDDPELWRRGGWEPATVAGDRRDHLLAFVRRQGSRAMLGVALLHGAAAIAGSDRRVPSASWWGDTSVKLTGEPLMATDLLRDMPVQLAMMEGRDWRPLLESAAAQAASA